MEFVFLAVMLMVPTVYALLAISHAQAGAYAAVASAQQALQVIEAGHRSEVSAAAAQHAAQFAARDYGVREGAVRTELSCSGDCTEQRSIRVRVSVAVQAPLLGWISEGGAVTMSADLASWGGRYE